LDRPVEFLNMLGRQTRKLLMLQTWFSLAMSMGNEGRAGHWYDEPAAGEDVLGWGAHENRKSFWLGKLDLMASVRDAGFDIVAEQLDFLDDIPVGTETGMHSSVGGRSMFVGIKE
jgi:hypothetical protein